MACPVWHGALSSHVGPCVYVGMVVDMEEEEGRIIGASFVGGAWAVETGGCLGSPEFRTSHGGGWILDARGLSS